MEGYELKKAGMKNCSSYYFDDIITIEDLVFIIFYWMKNQMKMFWFMTFLTLIGVKLLCIRFGKTNGFIRVYNRSRYLVLFGPGKYDVI